MELNQKIFQRLYNYYKRITSNDNALKNPNEVLLAPLKPRLTLIARAISGQPINIVTSEREGGWKDFSFYLPERVAFSESAMVNSNFYLFRIIYLITQMKLNLNLTLPDTSIVNAQEEALRQSSTILTELFQEYPLLKEMYENLKQTLNDFYNKTEISVDTTWLFGRFMYNSNTLNTTVETNKEESQNDTDEIGTELEANPSDDVQCLKVDTNQQENYTLSHNFEKVETLDEFNGNWRDFDGDDTLSEQEDALRDLNLKHTVRVNDSTHSVYKAEFSNSTVGIQANDIDHSKEGIPYDEWNYKKRNYLKAYCTLYHKFSSNKDVAYYKEALQNNQKSLIELRKMFAQIANDLHKVDRLAHGEEIDFDAFVDCFADIQSKKTVNEKLYSSKLKRRKDISVLILIDASLSTDGYAAGRRVLDIEKEAVTIFGEVLEEYDISFQIDTFSSKTRNQAIYTTVKSFKEKWHVAKHKIGDIQPENYTRIGTALRHAGQLINAEESNKKWILLFSDGKPNDFDTYEGKHGIEDVKQALRELHQNKIQTFSFAIESSAKYYLPMMFGQSNYYALSDPKNLPFAFAKFYKRATN